VYTSPIHIDGRDAYGEHTYVDDTNKVYSFSVVCDIIYF